MHDLTYALRTLAKTPGFTAVAVLTLAIAIGVNSTIFSLVDGLLLRPTAPDDAVALFTARADATRDYRQFSHREFTALRESSEVFDEVAAITFSLAGLDHDRAMRRSFVFLVSENYFDVLGTRPALGRFFTAEETRPNANLDVLVASHGLWQRLGGKPDILGRKLHVNGRPFTIIGVAPRGFSGGNALLAPEVWLPLGIFGQLQKPFADSTQLPDLSAPANYTLNVIARLAPGVSLAAAQARATVLTPRLDALRLAATDPARELQVTTLSRFSISTEPATDGSLGLASVLLVAMAGVILLIACLNLANMLLARGTSRTREIAIRLALGASRGRLVRQLLVEGFVLAAAGGTLGLLLCLWSGDLLVRPLRHVFESMSFSLAIDFTPDARVLGATLVCSLLATLAFSLGPALRATRSADVIVDLKQQVGDPALHGRWNRFFALRHCLVMAQIALSLTLLFSAGLFVRSALESNRVELGFSPPGALVAELDYSLGRLTTDRAREQLLALAAQARELPGVAHAGIGTLMPFGNITNTRRVLAGGEAVAPAAAGEAQPGFNAIYTGTSPGFFEALGVRLRRGRDFTSTEAADAGAPPVAIIDERLAQDLFGTDDPVGRRLRYSEAPEDGSPAELEVVGVVSSFRHEVISRQMPRRLFVPLAQGFNPNAYLQIRFAHTSRAQTAAQLATVRQTILRHDPEAPLLRLLLLEDFVERDITLWLMRITAVMFGLFGLVALVLAIVGVYGVKAYAVARRTREIGIRMALGARPRDVFSQVMNQSVGQMAVALAVGMVLAIGAGYVVRSLNERVNPLDPVVLLTSAGLLTLTTLIACFIPARRATRVNPTEALRSE